MDPSTLTFSIYALCALACGGLCLVVILVVLIPIIRNTVRYRQERDEKSHQNKLKEDAEEKKRQDAYAIRIHEWVNRPPSSLEEKKFSIANPNADPAVGAVSPLVHKARRGDDESFQLLLQKARNDDKKSDAKNAVLLGLGHIFLSSQTSVEHKQMLLKLLPDYVFDCQIESSVSEYTGRGEYWEGESNFVEYTELTATPSTFLQYLLRNYKRRMATITGEDCWAEASSLFGKIIIHTRLPGL